MSYRHHSFNACVVEQDFVKETCPEELEILMEYLEKYDYALDQLAYCCRGGGDVEGEIGVDLDEPAPAEITNAYEKLCMVFQEKTGLGLNLSFADGDTFYGEYWEVEGVYILSPAGKKNQEKITEKTWLETG